VARASGTDRHVHEAPTVDAIGATAGSVWHFLRQHGQTALPAVKAAVGVPDSMLHMAIGWLAREGKLEIRRRGRRVELSLTE
jgi:Winged helix-turn-helix domain (DUF2582)